MTGQQILAAVADGSIEQELNWIEVHRGDFIFLPWGTVHALGAGISLCEVQEFSDLTYRMYDYGRGRALHLEKALDVIRTHPSAGKLEPVRMEAGQRCHDLLVACRHFVVERIASAGEWQDTVESPGSQVLIFLAGEGEVMTGEEPYSYAPEQAWRMPEGTGSYRIVPRSESSWLRIHVPVSLDAVRARLVTAGIAERERNRVIVEDV